MTFLEYLVKRCFWMFLDVFGFFFRLAIFWREQKNNLCLFLFCLFFLFVLFFVWGFCLCFLPCVFPLPTHPHPPSSSPPLSLQPVPSFSLLSSSPTGHFFLFPCLSMDQGGGMDDYGMRGGPPAPVPHPSFSILPAGAALRLGRWLRC